MKRSSEESKSHSKNGGKKRKLSKPVSSADLPASDDLVEDEDAVEKLSVVPRKSRYDEYFNFLIVNEVKTGVCKICAEKNVNIEVRMVRCNTTGLVNHLMNDHQSIYALLFPNGRQTKQQQTRQVQNKVSQ